MSRKRRKCPCFPITSVWRWIPSCLSRAYHTMKHEYSFTPPPPLFPIPSASVPSPVLPSINYPNHRALVSVVYFSSASKAVRGKKQAHCQSCSVQDVQSRQRSPPLAPRPGTQNVGSSVESSRKNIDIDTFLCLHNMLFRPVFNLFCLIGKKHDVKVPRIV